MTAIDSGPKMIHGGRRYNFCRALILHVACLQNRDWENKLNGHAQRMVSVFL